MQDMEDVLHGRALYTRATFYRNCERASSSRTPAANAPWPKVNYEP